MSISEALICAYRMRLLQFNDTENFKLTELSSISYSSLKIYASAKAYHSECIQIVDTTSIRD